MRGRLLIGACVALGLLVAGGLLIAAPGKDVQPVLAPSTLGGCWTLLPPAALGASNGTLADLATLTSRMSGRRWRPELDGPTPARGALGWKRLDGRAGAPNR